MAEYSENIPAGLYKCIVEKCEAGFSKAGKPQLIVWYRIVEGEFAARVMFCYQSTANETGKKIAAEVKEKVAEAAGNPVQVLVSTKQSAQDPNKVFTNYKILGVCK